MMCIHIINLVYWKSNLKSDRPEFERRAIARKPLKYKESYLNVKLLPPKRARATDSQ